jgi:CBS domain-containing protein
VCALIAAYSRGGRPILPTRSAESDKLALFRTTSEERSARLMQVKDGMSNVVVTVGPQHTLRDAAHQMAKRNVGAAVVIDPDSPGPAIVTERDILRSIADHEDPASELVRDHLTEDVIIAAPDWSLERAAEAMIEGGFRHLVVIDGADLAGVLSMRDIVRCWARQRLARDAPAQA